MRTRKLGVSVTSDKTNHVHLGKLLNPVQVQPLKHRRHMTTGVCSEWFLNFKNLRFLLRIFGIAGAEGGLDEYDFPKFRVINKCD